MKKAIYPPNYHTESDFNKYMRDYWAANGKVPKIIYVTRAQAKEIAAWDHHLVDIKGNIKAHICLTDFGVSEIRTLND